MTKTYDVNIQIVPATDFTGTKFYSFGQKRSLGVRGIQKLVNVFAKYLLTPVGTDPTDLTYGTALTSLIGSNVILSDARELLDLAVDQTVKAIQKIQTTQGDVPDDEKLSTAAVVDYLIINQGPGFAAEILVTNVARQGLSILLPTLEVRI